MITICIVDDSGLSRRMIKRCLSAELFEFREFVSGEDALEHLQEGPVDVILMDYIMTGINGVETVKQLRSKAEFSSTPIIAITGGGEDVAVEFKSAGANHVFGKPFDVDKLQAAILK